MKLIELISLILLNCMVTFCASEEIERSAAPNKNAIFMKAGANYKGIKSSSTAYFRNSFFKDCKKGKYNEKKSEFEYKCGGKEVKAKADMCLSAAGGKLRVGYGFKKNTKDCKVKKNWFKCKAMDGNGKWHKTKYNLNFVMYFMKGKLYCQRNKPWVKMTKAEAEKQEKKDAKEKKKRMEKIKKDNKKKA